jgi:hypothetical protein
MLKNRSRHTLGNLRQVFPFSLSFFFPNLLLLPRAGVGTIAPPSCPNPSFHPWSSTRVWQRASISPLLALTQKVDVVCTTPLHFLDTLRHQPDLRYTEDRLRLNSLLTPPPLSTKRVRAASHYGGPRREAVGLSGQTLLRVQRNGLKIHSQ